MTDSELMAIAIEQAWEGVRTGNGEVGVVIARGGEPVYRGYNTINSSMDVTGHAEIQALRAVSEGLSELDLSAHTLFCTLEPCAMCACACAWARISRIVYGAGKDDVPDRYFELNTLSCREILAHARVAIEIVPGVLRERCVPLYRDRQSRDIS
jgi:tRNA(Arg) A34 adenosine deaminase TadA